MKKKNNYQTLLVYDDYNTLFQLFLKYNPQKVISITRRPFCWVEPSSARKNSKACHLSIRNSFCTTWGTHIFWWGTTQMPRPNILSVWKATRILSYGCGC